MTAASEPLEVLRRIRRPRPEPDAEVKEHCELCSAVISEEHPHLVDVHSRRLLCACRPCWLLFDNRGAGGDHFRAVPERYLNLAGLRLSPADWEALQVPVGVAFFFHNSSMGRVTGFYPSPAGATESELDLEAWDEIVTANPVLGTISADTEAVLVRDQRDRLDAYVVPIDACYELVGRLRQCWRGFDGGAEAHRQMDEFFAGVAHRARPAERRHG